MRDGPTHRGHRGWACQGLCPPVGPSLPTGRPFFSFGRPFFARCPHIPGPSSAGAFSWRAEVSCVTTTDHQRAPSPGPPKKDGMLRVGPFSTEPAHSIFKKKTTRRVTWKLTLSYVNRQPMGICCMSQGIQTGTLYQPRGVGWRGRWQGRGSRGRGHMYPCG